MEMDDMDTPDDDENIVKLPSPAFEQFQRDLATQSTPNDKLKELLGEPPAFGLIVSFPDQSASFVHGFEAGGLWERMASGMMAEIEATTHIENREIIARMADSRGWDVEVTASDVTGWDYTKLTKRRAPRERPNPHGLKAVRS